MTTEIAVTNNQLDMMRHAVGNALNGRNRYCAGGDDVAPWDDLVSKGLAVAWPDSSGFYVGPMYSITEAGYEMLGLKG